MPEPAASAATMLFLGKTDHWHTERAAAFCRRNFTTLVCLGRDGERLPDAAAAWTGDIIVSFLARWIVSPALLTRARVAAINFHPAPPEYPGIGCTNFALYESATVYGVTCHHLSERVDRGEIVMVRRFPVLPTDDVASLLNRTYDYQLALFYDVMARVLAGGSLPQSPDQWAAHCHTRRELNELATLRPGMSADEVRRRVRATTYGEWRPELRANDLRVGSQLESV